PAMPGVVGGSDDGFKERLVVVVVADQDRLLTRYDNLGATDGESRKSPHRQHPRGNRVVTAEATQPFPGRHQLGEVLGKCAPTFVQGGTGGQPLPRVPAAVRGPGCVPQRSPAGTRLGLSVRVER